MSREIFAVFILMPLVAASCSSVSIQKRGPASEAVEAQQVVYYSKGARKYFLASVPGFKAGTTALEEVLMVKTYDSQGGKFSEVACINDGKRPAYISPVYMKVEGNRISAISDTQNFEASGKLTGVGTLSGTNWDWNLLTFSMSYQACPLPECKSRVEDTNVVIRGRKDDGTTFEQLVGRKQLFLADGTPFELYDLEMDKVPSAEGKLLFSIMGCPSESLNQLFVPSASAE